MRLYVCACVLSSVSVFVHMRLCLYKGPRRKKTACHMPRAKCSVHRRL